MIDLDELARIHREKPLELATTWRFGRVRIVIEGDHAPEDLVSELIKMARFGVKVRQMADCTPRTPCGQMVEDADAWLRRNP